MDKEKLREEAIKRELVVLRNSYLMYERTRMETLEIQKKKEKESGIPMESVANLEVIEMIDNGQKDIVYKYKELGGDEEDLVKYAKENIGKKKRNLTDRKDILKKLIDIETKKNGKDTVRERNETKPKARVSDSSNDFIDLNAKNVRKGNSSVDDDTTDNIDLNKNKRNRNIPKMTRESVDMNSSEYGDAQTLSISPMTDNVSYDVIPIPSMGKCYSNGKDKLRVKYLTANDENLIVSPNLYKDNSFIDHILANKIDDDSVNIDEMLKGDKDAIILWLRATAYGVKYPINVRDGESNTTFRAEVDLSKIKYKKLTLDTNENGYFEFTTPVRNDVIEFRFLSDNEHKILKKHNNLEDTSAQKSTINSLIENVNLMISDYSENIDDDTLDKLSSAVSTIEECLNDIEVDGKAYNHGVTNQMISEIISINGNSDRKFVSDYVLNMNTFDSRAFRKFVIDNEPGLDFNIEVERPESLGGGSIKSFLSIDQFLFLTDIIE